MGKNFCRSGWEGSELNWKGVGLVRIPSEVGKIGQNICGSGKDESEFLQEQVG